MRVSKFKIDYGAEISPKLPKKKKNSPIKKTEICNICYEEKKNIKYINCIQKGIQNHNFGKFGFCCKDKAICHDCRDRCRESCPFCRNHTLYNLKTHSFPKKKAPWKEREIKRLKKIAKKIKKQKKEEKKEERKEEKFRLEIKRLILKNQRLGAEIEKLRLKQRCDYINNNLY